MFKTLVFPFYNREEGRLRALWRLLLQLAASLIIALPVPAVIIMLYARSQGIPFEGIPFVHPTPLAEEAVTATPWINLIMLTLSGLGASLTVWLAGRYLDHRPSADFGLHLNRAWWRDLAAGAVIGALLPTILFGIAWMAGWVEVVDLFHTATPGTPFTLAFLVPLLFFVGIAVNEELVVRGYMLTNAAEGLNLPFLSPRVALLLALLISALNFGLGHKAAQLSTLNITLAGIWLGLAYILTGQLALPIGLHLTWNIFLGNVFGFPVSGNVFDPTTVIAVERVGPALWLGGSYGPEAGLLGTIAFALGIVLVLAWVRTSRGEIRMERAIARYAPPAIQETGRTPSAPEVALDARARNLVR